MLAADIACLPLAMNAIGIVAKWVHTLMTFSYLTPWLFFVMAVEQLYRRDDLRKDWERLLRWGYSLLACVVAGLTVLCGIRLANICYTKAYARYTEGLADSIRLTNLIEAIPNYVKGETPVAFVGVSDNRFPTARILMNLPATLLALAICIIGKACTTAPVCLGTVM